MKHLLIPLLFVSISFALYEQSKEKPNVYIIIIALAVFVFCMMRLGSKIPGKNQEKEEDDVQ